MRDKGMNLRQQVASVIREYVRVVRKHPWMLSLPVLFLWRITTTPEERQQLLDETDDTP